MTTTPMRPERVERKLLTILAADFAAFSRLMETAEERTHRTLQAHRALLDEVISLHRGTIFHTAGDSVLAWFDSPVEAVRAALGVQDALTEANAVLPEAERLLLRIGVHLGDVIFQDRNLLGDAVNVAARIESIAEPGGLLISGPVYEQIAGKIDIAFEPRGTPSLKNISRSIPVFGLADALTRSGKLAPSARVRSRRIWMTAGLGFCAIIAAAATALYHRSAASPHWLNGTWAVAIGREAANAQPQFCASAGPSCRIFKIDGVTGDGRYSGVWGFNLQNTGTAVFTIANEAVRVVVPSGSIVDARLAPNGLLNGRMEQAASVGGGSVSISMRKLAE